MQEPTQLLTGEGRRRWSSTERISSIGPAGVVATACRHSGSGATREAPAVIAIRINWQLARARPGRVGWRRGPYYRRSWVTRVEGRDLSRRRTQEATQDMGIDDESSHPELCSEVAGGVTRNIVCLLRQPDAVTPPVRFDKRGCGNVALVRILRHRQTKGPDSARAHLNRRATPRPH
jgi:hypothetical protein